MVLQKTLDDIIFIDFGQNQNIRLIIFLSKNCIELLFIICSFPLITLMLSNLFAFEVGQVHFPRQHLKLLFGYLTLWRDSLMNDVK